jgi:hypothetical protein
LIAEQVQLTLQQHSTFTMAALDMSLMARSEYALHQLAKREKNWAAREPGVIVVFCVVFLVAILVIGVFISKRVSCRKSLHVHTGLTCISSATRSLLKIPPSRLKAVVKGPWREAESTACADSWIPNVDGKRVNVAPTAMYLYNVSMYSVTGFFNRLPSDCAVERGMKGSS